MESFHLRLKWYCFWCYPATNRCWSTRNFTISTNHPSSHVEVFVSLAKLKIQTRNWMGCFWNTSQARDWNECFKILYPTSIPFLMQSLFSLYNNVWNLLYVLLCVWNLNELESIQPTKRAMPDVMSHILSRSPLVCTCTMFHNLAMFWFFANCGNRIMSPIWIYKHVFNTRLDKCNSNTKWCVHKIISNICFRIYNKIWSFLHNFCKRNKIVPYPQFQLPRQSRWFSGRKRF